MMQFFADNLELCFFAVSVASYIGGVLTGSYMHQVDFSDWGQPQQPAHDPHVDLVEGLEDLPQWLKATKRQAE